MSLEEFARIIMSMKPALNNPDAFDKWMRDEEIEFKEPRTQKAMKEVSTSQSSNYYIRLIIFSEFLLLLSFFINRIREHDF